jgi:hypothetical protein
MTPRRSRLIPVTVLLLGFPGIAVAQTITSVTLAPNSVIGGKSATGQVKLSGPAPSGGFLVQLSSGNPAAAHPSSPSVTVPGGATTQNFTVTTAAVGQNTAVTIAAFGGGGTKTALLNVQAVLESIVLGRTSVLGGFGTGGVVHLFIPSPLPGGLNVLLSSSNPAAATVPVGVGLPPGATTGAFSVVAVPVAQPVTVTISATVDGLSKTVQLTVEPPVFQYFNIGTNPTRGGTEVPGEVVISGPAPAGGFPVTLSSGDPAVVTVGASVTVPAGSDKMRFTIPTRRVEKATEVKITASASGATKTRQLTVTP